MSIQRSVYREGKPARVDAYCAGQLGCSRRRAQELISEGAVRVNGKRLRRSRVLRKGDAVEIQAGSVRHAPPIRSEKNTLVVLYEDAAVCVVDKPAGILTHPTAKTTRGTLVNFLLHATTLSSIGLPARPGVVHRLDRDTSGVIVFARTDEVHRDLAEQFKNRTVTKRYHAVVRGAFPEKEQRLECTISPARGNPTKMEVAFLRGKKAITSARLLRRCGTVSLVEVTPLTGRTHQVRVTLAHMGFPVIGDLLYGGRSQLISRTALHARKIGFFHPATGERIVFTAPLPADMRRAMEEAQGGNAV